MIAALLREMWQMAFHAEDYCFECMIAHLKTAHVPGKGCTVPGCECQRDWKKERAS